MNGIPQPFTEEFIAASLLGFDSIDTYLQTFRYLFPCRRKKFWKNPQISF